MSIVLMHIHVNITNITNTCKYYSYVNTHTCWNQYTAVDARPELLDTSIPSTVTTNSTPKIMQLMDIMEING